MYLETTSLKANFPYRTIGAVYKRDVHNRFVSQSVGVQTRPDERFPKMGEKRERKGAEESGGEFETDHRH